jgi:hypothetical protein
VDALILIITNIVSFIGGFVVCRWAAQRVAERLKEHTVTDDDHGTNGNGNGNGVDALPGSGKTWLVIGLAFTIAAAIGVYANYQAKQTQDCVRQYVSEAAPLSQARDKAIQALWDDFAAVQHLDQTDKAAVADARTEFFTDLDAEREASKALFTYRTEHAPSQECSS